MKVVIAIDSFKGSLSSIEAGNAVKEAVLRIDKNNTAVVRPLADGGEGTVEALFKGLGGEMASVSVTGPLGEKVTANYCILNDKTAIMEMSAAAGITLVKREELNPFNATTFGVGEMIKDAINKGCRSFIMGIGGSATNDGGVGMLTALGFEFLNEKGEKIPLGAKGLKTLKSIKCENALKELRQCSFKIACDVDNPLCGEKGCSRVFAPQKGADEEMIAHMDLWLKSYAGICKSTLGTDNESFPGAGAAGGLGFAFKTFLNAELLKGVEIILNETRLEEYIKEADLVITGEGRLDSQTVMGKAPIGVARLAKKYGKRVIAFAGCVTMDAEIINDHGIDAFFPILRGVVTLDEALNKENAYNNLSATAYQVLRLIK
ncbi:MAG: glycerate kinase [Clostridia bacterium]|nr:glycerate kinase [Clostridia bacterium]